MKSNKKKINSKSKEIKTKKKVIQKPKEEEYETTSVNFYY